MNLYCINSSKIELRHYKDRINRVYFNSNHCGYKNLITLIEKV